MSAPTSFQEPKQERSRRTLDRLVQAARDLVAEKGADATSIQDIVDRAGSSVGSFYARFGGKDDLFDYVERGVWDEARDRWGRALAERSWESLPLADLAGGVVQVLLDVGRHETRVRRALQIRRAAVNAKGPAEEFQTDVRRGLRTLLLAHTDEMSVADPERAVDLILRFVVGGLREMEAAGDIPDEEIVEEVRRLLIAYLGSTPDQDRPPTPGGVDFFDVWG